MFQGAPEPVVHGADDSSAVACVRLPQRRDVLHHVAEPAIVAAGAHAAQHQKPLRGPRDPRPWLPAALVRPVYKTCHHIPSGIAVCWLGISRSLLGHIAAAAVAVKRCQRQ